jgi:hypothetical protein
MSEDNWPKRACRSCGAEVIWTQTQRSGKRMPVDAEPVGGGKFILEPGNDDDTPIAIFIGPRDPYTGPRYESHFSTCPNASQHRQRGLTVVEWLVVVASVGLLAAVLLTALMGGNSPAEEVKQQRLRLISEERGIEVMCDTVTHDLIYVRASRDSRGGIGMAVVPGGCE